MMYIGDNKKHERYNNERIRKEDWQFSRPVINIVDLAIMSILQREINRQSGLEYCNLFFTSSSFKKFL